MVFHNYILSTCTFTIPLIFTFLTGIISWSLFDEITLHGNVKPLLTMIQHMYCLKEFRKMSFTIHFDFSLLAGIIIRPLFTTFYSCFVIIFLEKIPFFMLGRWYCTLCFLRFFLLITLFWHPLQLCLHPFSQWFMTFSTISSSKMFHHIFEHSWHVTAQDVSCFHLSINVSCILCIHLLFVKFLQKKFFLAFYAFTWCLLSFFGCVLRNFVLNSSWIVS